MSKARHARLLSIVAVLVAPAAAAAQGTSLRSRPTFNMEGAGVTDVIDAAEPGSLWSFRFRTSYVREQEAVPLLRERSPITADPGATAAQISPDGITARDAVARYTRIRQTLNLGAEIALYKDVSLTLSVPVILSETRALTDYGGNVTQDQQAQRLADGYTRPNGSGGTTGSSLFSLPFHSPERSGIDQIHVGFNANIFNQLRDRHLPTWLVSAQLRIPVGPEMLACRTANGQSYCPDPRNSPDVAGPGSTTYNGYFSAPTALTAAGVTALDRYASATGLVPGVSRRVWSVHLNTVISRRFGVIEPYAGLSALVEIPASGSLFRFDKLPFGQQTSMPPIQGSVLIGAEIVPWENRENWQRFSVDLALRGTYYSEGRDYSPLFDALGSSVSAPLTLPGYTIRSGGQYLPEQRVFFNGLTTTEAHARVGAGMQIAFQAARFLKFGAGLSVAYQSPYAITSTDACNANAVSSGETTPADRGSCRGNSVPDPTYRAVVDAPGMRFVMDHGVIWDFSVSIALTPRF